MRDYLKLQRCGPRCGSEEATLTGRIESSPSGVGVSGDGDAAGWRDLNAAGRRLAELIGAGGVLVLSGAGISTESGIPDYRGPDGTRRVTPMQHAEFVGSAAARQRYWARSFVGWDRFGAALPNSGHRAVAALERVGLVDAVVTQNVDGLHQAAGSQRVVELHGTLSRVTCLDCGTAYDRQSIQHQLDVANPDFREAVGPDGAIQPDGDVLLAEELIAAFRMPSCHRCAGDRLKPDVVFFGGSVPVERVELCYSLVAQARSLVVLGSSLAVMSGLRFVRRARELGLPIGIVTLLPTRGDELADVVWRERLGVALPGLLDQIDPVRPVTESDLRAVEGDRRA